MHSSSIREGRMDYFDAIDIVRFSAERQENVRDTVAVEYPLTIFINGRELVTLLCSPVHLEFLVVGFLFSEGFIKRIEDIKDMNINEKEGIAEIYVGKPIKLALELYGSRTITSGCGRSPIFYNVKDSLGTQPLNEDNFKISYCTIVKLIREFDNSSQIFKQTGGVHSCALASEGRILAFHEDIGRHNAMDKIIGQGLKEKVCLQKTLIVTSGRISSEMIIKAAKGRIPVVISRSAPTGLAIDISQRLNITLIGFARGKRFNVYSGIHRIATG